MIPCYHCEAVAAGGGGRCGLHTDARGWTMFLEGEWPPLSESSGDVAKLADVCRELAEKLRTELGRANVPALSGDVWITIRHARASYPAAPYDYARGIERAIVAELADYGAVPPDHVAGLAHLFDQVDARRKTLRGLSIILQERPR